MQKQAWNEEYSNVSQANSGLGAAAANYSSENRRKISRQRAYASDRVSISRSINCNGTKLRSLTLSC